METQAVRPYHPGDNPIRTVDGKKFPYYPAAPDGFKFNLADVSAKDANRAEDEDITMYKKRIGQVDEIILNFETKTFEQTHEILSFFQNEYVLVEYANPLAGGYVTKQMYVGDRHCTMKYGGANIWGGIVVPLKARKGGMRSFSRMEG